MIIGLVSLGKMKQFRGQWIESQFFTLGIPLFPIKSMFVLNSEHGSREGFEIGLYGKSIIKGYLSFLSLIIGILLCVIGAIVSGEIILFVLGFVLLIVSLYFFFVFGKSTEKEDEDRILFHEAVGVNALPEYLDRVTAMSLRNRLLNGVKEVLADKELNWIKLVENNQYDRRLLPALFAAMGYHARLEEKEKFNALFEKLKAEYRESLEKRES